MKIELPEPCLVVLVGASGAGKSTFAAKHFAPTEVISSDWCRGAVCDDFNSLEHSSDAFELLHFMVNKRLELMRLTVVDATNVQKHAREALLHIAKANDLLAVAIVLDLDESISHERNEHRPDRDFGPHVVRGQKRNLRRSLKYVRKDFRRVFHLRTPEEVDAVEVVREPLYNNRREEMGPFDLVGDVHGCADELEELLGKLGYGVEWTGDRDTPPYFGVRVTAPEGRRLFFVGDFNDRGPRTPDVYRIAMSAMHDGHARAVPGNHDVKLERWLRGRKVTPKHGLDLTIEQLEAESQTFRDAVRDFIKGLVSHEVVHDGELVVAHAGVKESYQGRSSGRVRSFCLYGDTTGEKDEYGLPVRLDWARDYRGSATVIYGHTPVAQARWVNNTMNLDTGCVFGGKLTALRWPENQLVEVPARQEYCPPSKPFLETAHEHGTTQATDLLERYAVQTRLHHRVTIRAENSAAAFETLNRFGIDRRWLVYLPPTMSPSETSSLPDYLEHPLEALQYFRSKNVAEVVCEEKHMGSRAVVVLARDAEAAATRFGDETGRTGVVYTRTGRPFFRDAEVEQVFLSRVRAALEAAGTFERFTADWIALDGELMPWSAKATELLVRQYAAVGAAASHALPAAARALEAAGNRGLDGASELADTYRSRAEDAQAFTNAYRHYCWPVESVDDLRFAPFQLLAAGDQTFFDKDHVWHMETLQNVVAADPSDLLHLTGWRTVHVDNEEECSALVDWWLEHTNAGGEGLVIKPRSVVATHEGKLVQPGVKCRGREYLRIIYGLSYTEPEQLQRLKNRRLGRKRSLALREFALGVEALEGFVGALPFRDVHRAVFGVLALETEPVDPRL